MKICHRGITEYFPENTIGSIYDTIQSNKYDGIEIDIQLTKDEEWIIYHDHNLYKLNGIEEDVSKINYSDINMIDWKGNNFKVNKFSLALELPT